MARVNLGTGEVTSVSSNQETEIFGRADGAETVTIGTGSYIFSAFGRGGDTVVLAGNAGSWNVVRSGGTVTLTNDANNTTVVLRPGAGQDAINVAFADGTRSLVINGNAVLLGTQAIDSVPTEVTAGSGGNGGGGGGPVTPGIYTLTADAPSVTEGATGTKALTYTITLDRPATAETTINYSTIAAGTTATANDDFIPVAGTVTFAAGQQTATVAVTILGDNRNEATNETIAVQFSGAALTTAVTATGTVIDDDFGQNFDAGQNLLTGTAGDDSFFAFNGQLNGGDKVDGLAGNDTLFVATDPNLVANNGGQYSYAGFALTNVERIDVTNDALIPLNFDLSGSQNLNTLAATNGSAGINFNQVTSLASLVLTDLTNVNNAFVTVQYQDTVVAGGADAVSFTLNGTNASFVRFGSVGAFRSGIETVNLVAVGRASVINQLDTDLTTLNISGTQNTTINQPLNQTVRVIDASQNSANTTLSFGNNGVGASYTGSAGVNNVTGGFGNDTFVTAAGADVINAGNGNDVVTAGGGNNVINSGLGNDMVTTLEGNDSVTALGGNTLLNTGDGADTINVRGGGLSTIVAGEGNDTVLADQAGAFDANTVGGVVQDNFDFGGGVDTLQILAGSVDANFTNIATGSLETLSISNAGTTQLGGNNAGGAANQAQEAGIVTVNLQAAGNDSLDASTFSSGLTINVITGGNDTARTGTGADTFNVLGDFNLNDADSLVAGTGADTLNLDGDTFVSAGSLFTGFETITLDTRRNNAVNAATDGNFYTLTLDNDNAPNVVGNLTILGGGLAADTDGGDPLTAETVFFSSNAVTAFNTSIETGAANDTIVLGTKDDTAVTGAGTDQIFVAGGAGLVQSGADADTVFLGAGSTTVQAGAGSDTVTLGTGNHNVAGEGDNDTIVATTLLTTLDTVDGGEGTDTVNISGRAYVDVDFTNVTTVEVLNVSTDTNATLGAQAEEAGFRTIISSSAGASNINAGAFTAAASLTIDLTAGGNDTVATGAGNDTVITGTGNNTIVLGTGDDTVSVTGGELTALDAIAGGAGLDGVSLDNTGGAVVAAVDLAIVTSVESFSLLASGERISPDPDANSIDFTGANGSVGTLTPISVSAANLTDLEDSFTVSLNAGLQDPDFAFNITGSVTQTIVTKNNLGINNNINFTGGTGVDTLQINGGDLGATVTMNGGAGNDVIFQTGGTITDDSYVNVSNVEVLSGTVGLINATIGSQANGSGLATVQGTTGIDRLIVDAAFTNALRVVLGGAGNDTINAAAALGAITFAALDSELTTLDVLSGGTTAADVLEVTAGNASADATSVTGVETIRVLGDLNPLAATGSTLVIDTLVADVNGGVQTIDATGLDSLDAFTLTGGTATAALSVSSGAGNDALTTGTGNDTINANGGNDVVRAGNGTNFAYGGAGDDTVITGTGADTVYGDDLAGTLSGNDRLGTGAGLDTVFGGLGNDAISSGADSDQVDGGAGTDGIFGGLGADTLTGGADADIFYYQTTNDSATTINRDTITDFVSGLDKIDVRNVVDLAASYPGGSQIRFVGNFNTFGDAQGAIVENDDVLDIVFQRSGATDANSNVIGGILWVDINDDGALNGNDIQIAILSSTPTAQGLTAVDVYAGLDQANAAVAGGTTVGGVGGLNDFLAANANFA